MSGSSRSRATTSAVSTIFRRPRPTVLFESMKGLIVTLHRPSQPIAYRFESFYDEEEVDEIDEDFEIDDELTDRIVSVNRHPVAPQPAN
jgi:hypothetical protein